MHNRTVTRSEVQAQEIKQTVVFYHTPGLTKWLHFVYEIGQRHPEYRVLVRAATVIGSHCFSIAIARSRHITKYE